MAGNTKKFCPPLQNLPPTDASFTQHVKRTMYQVMIWLNADRCNPPSVDPTLWGWLYKNNQMSPVLLPSGTSIASDFTLNWIKCKCATQFDRCKSRRCSCVVNNMLCTQFFNCEYDGIKCVRCQDVGIASDGDELSIETSKDEDE